MGTGCDVTKRSPACAVARLKRHLVPRGLVATELCGLELVVFGTHCFDAVNAFQPAHREMAARQAVVLLDKGKLTTAPPTAPITATPWSASF